jgi:quercetin dioxygenase-like cupin family protein
MSGQILWVLGHRIRSIDTDESYGLVEIFSPPHVPGPPPHYHEAENEFFLILKGTLDVMIDGEWRRLKAGNYLDLPPSTTHTFINNADQDAVWITGWRPKGFQKFFLDFGIPAHEAQAQQRSTAESLIENVVHTVARYGMHVAK